MSFKIKINRGLSCGFFVAAVLLTACSPVHDSLQPKTYAISGVEIGMLEEDVYKILGKPESYEVNNLADRAYANYDGLSLTLMSGGSRLDSPKLSTDLRRHRLITV